jgi:anti-sigma regulatory factor (Ser/Thr protein kinase)
MTRADGFRHEALLYRSDAEYLDSAMGFIKEGVAEDAPTMVVVDARRIRQLRSGLGVDAGSIEFLDMATVGQNPARIIPAWQHFVDRNTGAGRPLRGIGEPIWVGRSPDELVECRHHEALLNIAFADSPPFWLLCPYDAVGLAPAVIQEAHGTHPFVCSTSNQRKSPAYDGVAPHDLFIEPLPAPPPSADTLRFTDLRAVRRFVLAQAETARLGSATVSDAVLAINEVSANALRHGRGRGQLTIWTHDDTLLCQIDDEGHILDPLVGRRQPTATQSGGRGLWITNQLCWLVQIRSSPGGTTVRLHFRGAGAA